ncbi:MAG: ribonuclease III [Proteobacteria bacterium]|nr:ribonuclease III [Pseudomonadota bacterium]
MKRSGNGPKQTPSPADLGELERALGHDFNDPDLLTQALTHSSATPDRLQSNERLEFLGDRVLGLSLARLLIESFPGEDEGKLGYRFSALARAESLARVAENIGLAPYLILSEGEKDGGGRDNPGILSDAMEAVIAALYLDGGLAAAAAFIEGQWRPLMAEDPVPPKDAKTKLQEWAQGQGLPLPEYRVTAEDGPAHAPRFTVRVALHEMKPASGQGPSKQAAEQAAADALMEMLQEAGKAGGLTGKRQENEK